MKRIKYLLMAAGVLFALYAMAAEVWKTKTEESYIEFSARSAVGKVHGKIPGIQADIRFSENDLPNSKFNAWTEPKNLDTDNKKRDNHLKSKDFLDVGVYPTVKFVSKSISKADAGYAVTGDLTIKDVTNEITFPFTFEDQGSRGIFRGSFSINRRDYHVGGKTKLAGDKITVNIVTVVAKPERSDAGQ